MISTKLLLISHLTFIAFFLGGQFYYLFILQPASFDGFTTNHQIHFLKSVLKRQNPVLLFVLCLVVLTGGFMITPLKSQLGANYYSAFGYKLLPKLGLFFLTFIVTAYQTLGIGFKIRYLDPASINDNFSKKLNQVRTLMTVTTLLNIGIIIYIIYYAINRF